MSALLRNTMLAATLSAAFNTMVADAAVPPDLRTDPVATSARTAPAGAALRAGITTKNVGGRRSRPSTTALFLSKDSKKSRDDRLLVRVKVPGIQARRGKRITVNLKLPKTVKPGLYRVLACADSARKVKERSERNNCRASRRRFTITAAGAVVPVVPAPGPGTGGTGLPPDTVPAPAPDPVADDDGDGTANGSDCAPADPAVHPGAPDKPDVPTARDTNCDGIDGDIARSLFVATTGDDANPGTPALPKRTLSAAVAAAEAPRADVIVGEGEYPESLDVRSGVSVYGGYAPDWSRALDRVTRLRPPTPVGLEAVGISEPTTVQLLTVHAADARESSASSYGARLHGAPALVLERVTATAGRGADGARGSNGRPGRPGEPGSAGTAGACDDPDPEYDANGQRVGRGSGGAGGASPVGRTGGRGGHGNPPRYAAGNATGARGGGSAGGAGGPGGASDNPGQTGAAGSDGANGANGADGLGGRGGTFSGSVWTGNDGQDGRPADHGHGGGGGGGGGGQECVTSCLEEGLGNGGGGGGGGGEAGTPGSRGRAGGGSFGIVITASNGAVIRDSSFTAAAAGSGGRAGSGAIGGAGGVFGNGVSYCTDEIGRGARGGLGGYGGTGGDGGGGAGGPSIALVTRSSEVTIENTHLAFGTAGAGGSGVGSPGGAGEAKVRDQQ